MCQKKMADTVASIAQQIIDLGILAKKSYDDCQHIAAAIANLEGRKPNEILALLYYQKVSNDYGKTGFKS